MDNIQFKDDAELEMKENNQNCLCCPKHKNDILFYKGTRNGLSRMVKETYIFEGYVENSDSCGFGRIIKVNTETGGITVRVGIMTKGLKLNGYGCF